MSPKPLHEMTEIELIPFKIHAICYDLGYNIETARIMFYIYHHYHQNYKQEKESENALELMLGIKTIDDEIKKIPNQAEALKAYNFIKKTVQDIKRIDFEIKESNCPIQGYEVISLLILFSFTFTFIISYQPF